MYIQLAICVTVYDMSNNADDTIHVRLGSAEKKQLVVKFARENGYPDTSEFIRYLIDNEMGSLQEEREDPFIQKLRASLKKPEVKKIIQELVKEK